MPRNKVKLKGTGLSYGFWLPHRYLHTLLTQNSRT